MEGALRPGTILLEKYRVESLLGRGGMGVVLKVTHLHLGEELALKVLSPEAATTPDVTARFLREAQSAVRLRGEHVAKVFDVGILPDRVPYMVMEYLRGVDLAGELERRRVLMPGEAVDYVLQACEALAEAHANEIVHRDIKAANLFLTTRPDGTPLVKVLDFGISKVPFSTSGVMTKTDIVMGSPGYMSPEQMKASKDVDARTDIWALGIVLYECLNGRRPFEAESFSAVVLMAGTEPPPPMDPRIPRGLQAVVLRCLEKDRKARFSSVAELAAALAPFARDQRAAALVADRTRLMLQRQSGRSEPAAPARQTPVATTLSGSAGVTRPPSRRRRYAIAGVMSLLGAIIISTAVIQGGPRRSASSNDRSSNDPVANHAGRLAGDRDAAPSVLADAEVAVVATLVDAAEPTTTVATVGKPDDEKAQRLKCAQLKSEKKWQELDDCSKGLEALGLKDEAGKLRAMAKQETKNEAKADTFRKALREVNLKAAQATLKEIGEDSVYYVQLRDAFTKAEAPVFNEYKARAEKLAAAHNCTELNKLKQQASATSERVFNMVVAVKCTERTEWDSPFMPLTDSGRDRATQTVVTTPKPNPCDTMDVDDVMKQAENQFGAGFAKAALQLMHKALVCRENERMYRLATMYACASHDLAAAKSYYNKVSKIFQPPLEEKCRAENTCPSGCLTH
jgi:serine/threonine-protein kinase